MVSHGSVKSPVQSMQLKGNNVITGTALLEAVADQIEGHPDQYDQGSWGYIVGSLTSTPTLDIIEKMGLNDCGTRGCIAGWAVALNVHNQEVREALATKMLDVGSLAEKLLGLETYTADILFNEMWKPAAGMDVPEALRFLAKGADIYEVTNSEYVDLDN